MHFSIPNTQEIYTSDAISTYTAYNIFINGSFHCCLRYKQLHALHEQLRKRCYDINIRLPAFPPKRLLPLTAKQLEQRRAALEQYLQYLGQDTRIAKMDFLQNFFLNAQLETAVFFATDSNDIRYGDSVTLDVYLMNGQKIKIENFRIGNNASCLLRQACDFLRLPKNLVSYFCLFLSQKDVKDSLFLIRLLMDFESPYLSRRQFRPCQILLRKCYFDPVYDSHLLKDSTALNLLYVQTISDVEREWIIATQEASQKLCNLQNHSLKKEYLELARQLPLYGCLQFAECKVDYDRDTIAKISIGNKELSMRSARGLKIYETKFRVTRMRCWRVTALHDTKSESINDDSNMNSNVHTTPKNLQLSFEYLMSKQTLRWITITSAQAMLMSVCLQAMVDELLLSKSSRSYENLSQSFSDNLILSSSTTPTFMNDPLSSTSTSTTNSSTSSSSSPTAPVKFISQPYRTKHNPKVLTAAGYAAVFFRNTQEEPVLNEAFEGIGDDDL